MTGLYQRTTWQHPLWWLLSQLLSLMMLRWPGQEEHALVREPLPLKQTQPPQQSLQPQCLSLPPLLVPLPPLPPPPPPARRLPFPASPAS